MLHNSPEENLNPSSSVSNLPSYQMRTVEDYLELIPVDVRQTMTESQIEAVMQVIMVAIPKPAPKLVDLRFDVDLLLTRLFVVLMIGRDRRKTARRYAITPLNKFLNTCLAIILIIGLSFLISAAVVLVLYLIKSLLGIDLLPGHITQVLLSNNCK
ncbi:MAG: hypothetical protein ACK456_17945 [Pseudanabaenaceae cyanobacterium]|jgi:hypothetical protein